MAHDHSHAHDHSSAHGCTSISGGAEEHRGPEISCGCGHCHTDAHDHGHEHADGGKRDIVLIAAAAVMLIAGVILEHTGAPWVAAVVVFAIAYLVVGFDILRIAWRNIRTGDFFDENFLMCIASLGAFAVGEYPEAVAVMLFYRVGECFEDRAVDRSRTQIMDAVDMRPETVHVLDDFAEASRMREVHDAPARNAQEGDYLLVHPGERIPLDATVVEGTSRIDTSPITGEPMPVSVSSGMQVVSGCVNQTGQLVVRVDKPLDQSMVTRILDAVEHAAARKPQMERFITRFARIYTPIVVAIAAATVLVGGLVTGDVAKWAYTACTFLVISCPCAIVISVPLAFFAGIGAASKQGILVKGGNSLEALKGISAVVMDKTGTVTQGTCRVQRVVPAEGFDESELLVLAASAEAASTHPIAQSIAAATHDRGLHLLDAVQAVEHPGKGIVAHIVRESQDSVDVACGNEALMEVCGAAMPTEGSYTEAGNVLVAVNGSFAGVIEIADAVKGDSAAAIAVLKDKGVHTVMLTGDASDAAQSVAQATGIDEVHAGMLPEEKVVVLEDVRARKGAAMFVGDGINDAPVLAAADVGAAMGSGSDAAIEAADVVFMTSSLSAVPASIELAQKVHRIVVENIVFALAVKGAVMLLGFFGFASMWAAVFADVGVALLCILNSVRLLRGEPCAAE